VPELLPEVDRRLREKPTPIS